MHEDQQRHAAADGLVRCAAAHHRGDLVLLEKEFDQFEDSLQRDATVIPDDLLIILNFWDAWVDSSNHEWQYHEPIREADWPRLALEIADYLRGDTTALSPIVQENFAP